MPGHAPEMDAEYLRKVLSALRMRSKLVPRHTKSTLKPTVQSSGTSYTFSS